VQHSAVAVPDVYRVAIERGDQLAHNIERVDQLVQVLGVEQRIPIKIGA
jgi:hypothetical protein